MRRRPDLTLEAFARHYREVHSEFGYKTWGVKGYAQLHVDPLASAEAATLSGLGTCNFDGVSQLYMPALTKFLLATPINGARGMIKDEKRFVDRDNSIMFASRVLTSLS
jgi:EthD domain